MVVAYALAQRGKPYRWGAAGPGAFDCSGLVAAAYARVGLVVPHFTGALAGRGRPVTRAQLAPGDLVFPSGGHVGIYIGGGMFVHAPRTGKTVTVAPLRQLWTARRLL